MRLLSVFLILLCSTTAGIAQSGKLFKSNPVIDSNTPQWARLMYSSKPNVWQVKDAFESYYKTHPFEKTTHTQNYKYWARQVLPFTLEDGTIQFPSLQQMEEEEVQYENLRQQSNGSRGGGWTCIGPFETRATEAGEPEVSWQANVYCMDVFNGNPSVLYCGTESGGIFTTNDKGLNWTWASLNQTFTSIHAIKIHPTNSDIVFAGDNQRIYRTTDGGASWTTVFNLTSLGVNDISINPLDPNIVLAACDYGLYRSTDGGSNWTQLYAQASWDIELKPSNGNVVYLLKSNPVTKMCEFYRSNDRGTSFIQQTNGWYNSTDANRNDGGARMSVTPADTSKVYVVLIGNSKAGDQNFIGVYRSDDGGSSWLNPRGQDGGPYTNTVYNLATIDETSGFDQGYYNLSIAASHTNAEVLFVGCLSMSKSEDGAASFEYVGGYHGSTRWMHPDQQDIKISGTDQWVANDGGIAYSTDDFATLESRKNGITASDFWGFGSGWNEDILVGGRYHNGNTGRNSNYPVGKYHRLGGAEASTGYVNPGSEQCYFSDISTQQLGQFYNDPAQDLSMLSMYPNESYFGGESSEIEFHPYCYNVFYIGNENKIYRTSDGGNTFDSLYAFGTNTSRQVKQIEVSRSNPNVIYAYAMQTSTLAKLLKSTDGGVSWSVVDFPTGVASAISGSITLSATDENNLWVCFGHSNNNNKVYVTYNGGINWVNLTTSTLSGHRAYNIVHQLGTSSLVYLATNKAVFYKDSMMSDWQLFNAGLPGTASSNLMKIFYKTEKLRLATYGHGIWETDLVQPSQPIAQPTVDKLQSFCSRDTFYFDSYSVLQQANASFNWTISPAPQFVSSLNVRNPKVVFGIAGNYSVSLTINDGTASSTKAINNMITIFPSQCAADSTPGSALVTIPPSSYAVTEPLKIGNTNNITFTAWIKPNGIQSPYSGIMFADNNGGCGLNFKQNNRLGYHWAGASGSWSWNNGPVIDSSFWNYVALVITPDSATIYWNGVGYTRVAAHPSVNFQAPLKIGRDRNWDDRTFNGQIDEACVFNRALTRDEIRELRHLTKVPQSDPSLVAYYQFNEQEGLVLDKSGINHAVLLDSSHRVVSSAPVGGGISQRVNINSDIAVTMSNTSAILDFKSSSTSPQGEVVFSRLNVLPYATPDTLTAAPHSYFIINNYGANKTALEFDSLSLGKLNVGNQYLNQSTAFALHSRNENEDGSWVSNNINPASTSIDNNFTITFNDAVNPVLNPTGQIVITRSYISSLDEVKPEVFNVYPNPVAQNGAVIIETQLGSFKIKATDAAGRVIYEGEGKGKAVLKNLFQAAGVYTLTIWNSVNRQVKKVVVN